ncbi:MAG: hypothetical protein QOD99_349, partial [Chthoniobacter sp.]|nr:hypothetical protein [Chthoniobacter sp.]
LVLDIAILLPLPEYYARMDLLVAAVKGSTLQPGVEEVLIPGETRWRNYHQQIREGVQMDSTTIASLSALAKEAKIATPW